MRDIIKKADFSQGVIYRYYTNLDEIYVDFINKHTTNILLEQKIDALISSDKTERIILEECFMAMGEYIEDLLKSVVGKTFFELTVIYAYDFKKRATLFPKIKFKQSLEYAQHKIVEYAMSNVEKGIFQPQIPVHSIILFVSKLYRWSSKSVAINTVEGSNHNLDPTLDIPEMFQTLAKAVTGFLEM